MTWDLTTPAGSEAIRTGDDRIRELKIDLQAAFRSTDAAFPGADTANPVFYPVPAGCIMDYAGAAAPTGWLLCDGASVLRATYPALFTAIGTTFGSADGTHFTLPDARGKTVIGVGTGSGLTARALADVGGEETHILSTAELASHSHGVTDGGHQHKKSGTHSAINVDNTGSTRVDIYGTGTDASSQTEVIGTGISIDNAGSGNAHNNMQPFIALNKIIKAH